MASQDHQHHPGTQCLGSSQCRPGLGGLHSLHSPLRQSQEPTVSLAKTGGLSRWSVGLDWPWIPQMTS